jgi:hypothetical protein
MKLVRKIKVVYRNRFFRAIQFFLPRNVILKFMVHGQNNYSVFFIGDVYDVRVRHLDFWHFRDRILFRVLTLND